MTYEAYELHLPEQCYQQAEQNLGETPEVREQCLKDIQKWLDQNPHINAHRDTKTILHFLRGAKFVPDKAKRKMIKYVYTNITREVPVILDNQTIPAILFMYIPI